MDLRFIQARDQTPTNTVCRALVRQRARLAIQLAIG